MDRRGFLRAVAAAGVAGSFGCSRLPAAAAPADLAGLDAISQATLVKTGELSARELVEAGIARLQAVNGGLNAVVATRFDAARGEVVTSTDRGELFGVPTLLKDLNNYPGLPFTRGSRAFARSIGDRRSAYTEKIDASGLIVLGKTNTPEFGLLPSTESLALGPARNPWNPAHSTGGSSGGAAAAVAARIVPIAQASDGGGSIRIPAAACGVFGLKPTRGRFPPQDLPVRGWPLSIRHAISVSVRDNALLLGLTEARGGELAPVGYVAPGHPAALRIALSVKDGLGNDPDPEVAAAVLEAAALLEDLGHDVVAVDDTPANDPGFMEQFLRLWAVSAVGAADAVARMTGRDARDTGLLEPWTLGLAEFFLSLPGDPMPAVVDHMARTEQAVAGFFGSFDAWLTPTLASPAPAIGYLAPDVDYETLLTRVTRFAAYTPIHNVAGTPAMSVPFGFNDSGLPLGIQIAAGIGEEARLLKLAYQLEQARPWADRLPRVNAAQV